MFIFSDTEFLSPTHVCTPNDSTTALFTSDWTVRDGYNHFIYISRTTMILFWLEFSVSVNRELRYNVQLCKVTQVLYLNSEWNQTRQRTSKRTEIFMKTSPRQTHTHRSCDSSMATIVWEKSRRQQASARTTQGANTQATFTTTSSACATFGLGSVLISKLLYYDFKEVSQCDSYYEWVLLADGRRRPDWWIYVKWLFSGWSGASLVLLGPPCCWMVLLML